ncbi:proteasome subunit beta type-7-like [Xenia sp. Carnegie-2017]|uniref:proteasome subunit beta type-7-like n=1 Tax=Xenia sp. Carnegie-2017 TaxID=2897299 RepID=UPI001F0334B0|nr:proteasome subunit beta type-7-like [Xenia sp. Carnegie-2017]
MCRQCAISSKESFLLISPVVVRSAETLILMVVFVVVYARKWMRYIYQVVLILKTAEETSFLKKNGLKTPIALKTGTTICGIVYKDGVILGADTRATEDAIVADKNCSKIHYIAPNMYCCGAGTAANTDYVTNLISSNHELHSLNTGRQVCINVSA